jgi:hypothetical protein
MTSKDFRKILVHNATDPNVVGEAIVEAQLTSAAALRMRLDAHGGVILGDEVGAGKTFVTFAVLAETLLRQPGRGAAIFVPSDPLTRKWAKQLREYLRAAVIDVAQRDALARRVVVMDRSMQVRDEAGRWRRPKKDDIVITQHSVFSRQTSEWDRVRCVEAWLSHRYRSVSGGARAPRQRFFAACGLDRAKVDDGWATWAQDDVLTATTLSPLDHVWRAYDAGRRDLRNLMRNAVLDVRREVGRRVLPDLALVVVDEAHNLGSTSSQIYGSLMYVLRDRFDSMLFLTATPFQLGRDELRNVVEFFRSARAQASERCERFDARVAQMLAGMDKYMRALSDFGLAWADLDDDEAKEVEDAPVSVTAEHFRSERARVAFEAYRTALEAKDGLEVGLRPFLVRTVRERHHIERPGVDAIAAESRVPVALVDRLISDRLAARDRTFVASALTSACSSWEALFSASITQGGSTGPALVALHKLRDAELLGRHPKASYTVQRCLDAARSGEKTLVFVERTETGRALRDELERELGKGLDRNAYQRLQDPRRFGWPSLRENYLYTLYPHVFGEPPPPSQVVALGHHRDAVALWQRVDVDGPINYKISKRFVEHLVFRAAAEALPGWRERAAAPLRQCVEHLLEPDYIVNGLDLRSGESNVRHRVKSAPERTQPRELGDPFVLAYARYRSPWASSATWLNQLSADARADLVDAAASAIASSHLQQEIERQEVDGDAGEHFRQTEALLTAKHGLWRDRFEAIAQEAANRAAGGGDHSDERVRSLASALRQSKRVIFVSGETDNATKQRAIEGFNTPLYPEVLLATGVLAEGVDLHRSCRRVIHHDLPWNPAKLEQRTGRIDRIGSLSTRLQERLGDVEASAIDVGLPYVSGTYDETIFRRVLARRREFRCLLGNKPEWDRDDLADGEVQPLGNAMVLSLQTQLGPDRDLPDSVGGAG